MTFEPIAEGWVSQRQANTSSAVAVGPRCALAANGDLVCTYMTQSVLGINDFVPMLSVSRDDGETWVEQGPIFPALRNSSSIFGSVSRSQKRDLLFYGIRTPVDLPGESFWCETTQGLKQNDLFWAKSIDSGKTWTDPAVIPMGIAGSAEAPGALCETRSGRWLACYAPYNTFDPALVVDRNQVVCLRSDDQGKTWSNASMLQFDESESGAAEAWVIELGYGRVLGIAWHVDHANEHEFPNVYALSRDGGTSWGPTRSTGIHGQSTALAALPDGRALFIYNQRKHGARGVWLAVVNPTESEFGVETNNIVWRAESVTQSGTSGEHNEWQDFAFGEPSITILKDKTFLVLFWCVQTSGQGIRYVKLRSRILSRMGELHESCEQAVPFEKSRFPFNFGRLRGVP